MKKLYNWFYTLIYHRSIIAHWKAEAMKDYTLKITEFSNKMDSIDATFEHPLNVTLVETMIKAFRNVDGAYNYCSLTANYEGDQFEFIVQRKKGKTPAELVSELKKEVQSLKKELQK